MKSKQKTRQRQRQRKETYGPNKTGNNLETKLKRGKK
jgi:hypothetical protein